VSRLRIIAIGEETMMRECLSPRPNRVLLFFRQPFYRMN
jgi:hypothetical protein